MSEVVGKGGGVEVSQVRGGLDRPVMGKWGLRGGGILMMVMMKTMTTLTTMVLIKLNMAEVVRKRLLRHPLHHKSN